MQYVLKYRWADVWQIFLVSKHFAILPQFVETWLYLLSHWNPTTTKSISAKSSTFRGDCRVVLSDCCCGFDTNLWDIAQELDVTIFDIKNFRSFLCLCATKQFPWNLVFRKEKKNFFSFLWAFGGCHFSWRQENLSILATFNNHTK